MIDVSNWPLNSGLWNLSNAELAQGFCANNRFGWYLGYSTRIIGGSLAAYTAYPQRIETISPIGAGRSVRPQQTIRFPATELAADVHFAFDVYRVAFNVSTGVVSVLFQMAKWSSDLITSPNGNGAQPDFDLYLYDASSGNLVVSTSSFIQSTGLPTGWNVGQTSRNVMTRGGIGTAFNYRATNITHNYSLPAVQGMAVTDLPANGVIAWRLRDPVAPYTLDYTAATTLEILNPGIYAPANHDTFVAHDRLDFGSGLSSGLAHDVDSGASDRLGYAELLTHSQSRSYALSAADTLAFNASGTDAIRAVPADTPAQSLFMTQSLAMATSEGDAPADSLFMTSALTTTSTALPNPSGSGGFIPVM